MNYKKNDKWCSDMTCLNCLFYIVFAFYSVTYNFEVDNENNKSLITNVFLVEIYSVSAETIINDGCSYSENV